MPWNAKAETRRLCPGIPKSDFWASAKEGIDHVGCVDTAQGFEFDHVGVIFTEELARQVLRDDWRYESQESDLSEREKVARMIGTQVAIAFEKNAKGAGTFVLDDTIGRNSLVHSQCGVRGWGPPNR